VIDLNDFDEAHPGGWEWDLRRLAASFWVAGRHNGTSEQPCGNAVRSCVASYRHELRRLADLPLFTRSFVRLDVDRLAAETAGSGIELGTEKALSCGDAELVYVKRRETTATPQRRCRSERNALAWILFGPLSSRAGRYCAAGGLSTAR
jgi:hypothetical protein